MVAGFGEYMPGISYERTETHTVKIYINRIDPTNWKERHLQSTPVLQSITCFVVPHISCIELAGILQDNACWLSIDPCRGRIQEDQTFICAFRMKNFTFSNVIQNHLKDIRIEGRVIKLPLTCRLINGFTQVDSVYIRDVYFELLMSAEFVHFIGVSFSTNDVILLNGVSGSGKSAFLLYLIEEIKSEWTEQFSKGSQVLVDTLLFAYPVNEGNHVILNCTRLEWNGEHGIVETVFREDCTLSKISQITNERRCKVFVDYPVTELPKGRRGEWLIALSPNEYECSAIEEAEVYMPNWSGYAEIATVRQSIYPNIVSYPFARANHIIFGNCSARYIFVSDKDSNNTIESALDLIAREIDKIAGDSTCDIPNNVLNYDARPDGHLKSRRQLVAASPIIGRILACTAAYKRKLLFRNFKSFEFVSMLAFAQKSLEGYELTIANARIENEEKVTYEGSKGETSIFEKYQGSFGYKTAPRNGDDFLLQTR